MSNKFLASTLVLLLYVNILISSTPNNKIPMLKGCIDSCQLKTIPHFKVYFEGIQTESNDDGFFTIPLEKKYDELSLIICKDFQPSFESTNTIKNLTISTQKPYKFYSFKRANLQNIQEKIKIYGEKNKKLEEEIKPVKMRARLINRQLERLKDKKKKSKIASLQKRKKKLDREVSRLSKAITRNDKRNKRLRVQYEKYQNDSQKNPAGDFWLITKKKFKHKKAMVPKNCVIACLNPKNINKVVNWSFALAPNFVAFPRIILKNNLETKNIKKKQSVTRASLKSRLASLDKNLFHEVKKENSKVEKNEGNIKVALVQ